MAKKTEVEKKKVETTALATKAIDFGDDAGKNAGIDRSEIVLPFINVLQSKSPAVEEELVPGAKPGLFINSVNNELSDEILFVPAYRDHVMLEFVPRKLGGGFRGKHEFEGDFAQKCLADYKKATGKSWGRIELTNRGNENKETTELTETFTLYGVLLDKEGLNVIGAAAIPFKSKKIKWYKKWRTAQNTYRHPKPDGGYAEPPLYAHVIRITTWLDKSSPSGAHYNVMIAPAFDGPVPGTDSTAPSIAASIVGPGDPRFEAAKKIAQLVETGEARVDYAAEAETEYDDEDEATI